MSRPSTARPVEPTSSLRRPPWTVKAVDLDPLGSVTASRFAIMVGAVSLLCAVGLTLTTTEQISSWPLAVLAVLILAGGYVWLVLRAFGDGVGLTTVEAAVGYGLVAASAVLSSVGQLGSNVHIRDDWGLMAVGLVLVALAPFRSPREILGYTVLSVALATGLAVVSSLTGLATVDLVPSLPIVLIAVAPAVGLGAGSVAYARTLASSLYEETRTQETLRVTSTADARRAFAADDVIGGIGALRESVVPFLARLDRTGVVEADDVRLAGELAKAFSLSLSAPRGPEPLSINVGTLEDPDGLLAAVPENARAALRALLVAAAVSAHGTREGIRLEASAATGSVAVTIESPDARALRAELMPYIRLMKLVLPGTDHAVVDGELRVACPLGG
ncbi:KEOPS complex subunit Pcc1 [Cnuibacter physcomitrellae]|uniref:KEOPS complex subunit Pcc1 n=1 Tax=Cnuibacter physcomitrellae TaxID=1619308 RepID=UPI0012F51AAF|nr:KEOPS complex subunit Pcc1 [Cnuibacter physcomitrellae]